MRLATCDTEIVFKHPFISLPSAVNWSTRPGFLVSEVPKTTPHLGTWLKQAVFKPVFVRLAQPVPKYPPFPHDKVTKLRRKNIKEKWSPLYSRYHLLAKTSFFHSEWRNERGKNKWQGWAGEGIQGEIKHVKSTDSTVKGPASTTGSEWPWTSHLASLCLNFFNFLKWG